LQYYNPNINNFDSNISDRFTDYGELLYSLRSVSKYLKWVRNIYIVTDNQIPSWLNVEKTSNNKIKIINHTEIIPLEYLPTFNSHVIELFLHKIPNLSKYFIYLNDDIVFLKEIDISHFFTFASENETSENETNENETSENETNENETSENETNENETSEIIKNKKNIMINVFLDEKSAPTRKGVPIPSEFGYRSAWKNSNKWLDENFCIEERHKMKHSPMLISTEILTELLNKLDYTKTLVSRFRSIHDYNVLCSIYMYYIIYTNRGIKSDKLKCETIFKSDTFNKIKDNINEIDVLCLNSYNHETFEYIKNKFSEKCEFEK